MKAYTMQYQLEDEAPEVRTILAETSEEADTNLRTELVGEWTRDEMDAEDIENSLETMDVTELDYKEVNEKHEWLIWSEEHRAWWKPQWNGYTPNREDAGRYTFEEACNIVKSANILKNDVPNEAMIRYEV